MQVLTNAECTFIALLLLAGRGTGAAEGGKERGTRGPVMTVLSAFRACSREFMKGEKWEDVHLLVNLFDARHGETT